MPDWAQIYDTYLEAASTTDARERAALLARCATADFELISPFPYHVQGRDEACAKLGEVAAAMPRGVLNLARSSDIDEHHGMFRVNYANRDDVGRVLSTGLHVVRTREDRIAQILVFVPDALA